MDNLKLKFETCRQCGAEIGKGMSELPNRSGVRTASADPYLRVDVSLYTGRGPEGEPGEMKNATQFFCIQCAEMVLKNVSDHVYK